MSFSTLGKTESTDSTANNGENDGIVPLPVTGRYKSLQTLHRVLKDAIGAHPHITMNDEDQPPIKWAKAVEAALYKDDGCLGEQQGEAPYTVKSFDEQYSESTITTPHDDLEGGERNELRKLFKSSENHERSDADGEFKLPVVNGERLPLLVADEDVLEDALDLLDELVNEDRDNDAGSTTDDVETFVDTAKFPVLEGTLEDLDAHLADSTPDEETLREMLEAEKENKDRKGGRSRLNAAIDALDEESDEAAETDDDNDASSTTSDVDAEKIATAVTTAVLEALDN